MSEGVELERFDWATVFRGPSKESTSETVQPC